MADTATLTLEFKTLADLSGLQDLVGQVQDGLESVTSAAGEMGAGIQDGLDRVTSSAESLGSGIETHVTKPAEAATPVVEKFDAGMDLMQLAMGKVKIALAALGISFGIAEIVRFASETLSASAASEQAALSLQLLIGNADVANQKLQQLHEFSLASGISLQELADAARQLVLAGTGPDNLVPRIKSFAEISATAGENIDSVVAAYQRMRFAIENGTTPIVRGMGQTSAATVLLIRTLMDETGKSESEVLQMFREHKVTIDLLNKAIAEATTGQGRYADAVSARSNTLRGAIGAVETAWHSLLLTVAEPIRDAITPVLTQLATKLRDLKPVVDEVGQRIGDLVQAFGKVAADEGWKNAISDAWRVLIDEISKMIVTGIGSAFKSLGQETLATHQAQSFINVYKDEIAAGENKVQAALVAVFAAVQSDITGKVIKAGQDTGENYVMAMADKIVSGKDQIAAALQALLGPLDAFDSRMKELGVGFKSLTAAGEGFDFTKAGLGAGGVPGADIGTTFRGAGAGEAGGADAAKTATDALAASKERLAIAEEHYQVELERVSVLESSGAISSTQAMAQRRQAAAAALEQLQKLRPEILALQQAELRAGDTKGFLQLQLELERLDLQTLKLHADMASNTFFGQMRAGLVQLTNEWSNLGKQIGGFLTQQFQNFASGAANALTSLILRTGDWRQAIVSLAQSFVQSLLQMVIQWVLSRTIMSALNKAFGAADQAATAAQASAASAAWAPAGIAASIATSGVAAASGLAAYLGAIATGTATTVASSAGGFAGGGFTGGVAGQFAGFVHGQEFVFSAPATRIIGREQLEGLHRVALTRPGYAQGGYVGGGATAGGSSWRSQQTHIYVLMDRKQLIREMATKAGHKIIYDAISRRRIDLGLPT